jgi:hypothetical protein
MASATLTFSQFSPGVKKVHTGIIANGGHLSVATTVCPSTVLAMCQVASGTTLLDYWLRIQTGGASQTFQMGTSATPSGILSVLTLSQTYSISTQAAAPAQYGIFNQGVIRGGGGTSGDITGALTNLMPTKISLSDDVQPSSVYIQGKVGAGCSASAFFTAMFFYTNDGMAGRTTIR